MRLNEIFESDGTVEDRSLVSESLSRTAFHYTNITSALKILTSGQFQLSSTLGSIEQQYAPKDYHYFLSTTRTRQGGYHTNYIGDSAVLFVLDGNWFNNHYISKPVDYWENRDPAKPSHRTHEAEDRVFSKDPSISIGGVTAVHVYVNPESSTDVRAWGRKTLIAAKRQGIQTYFYTDPKAWRNFDPRHQGDVSVLTGPDTSKGYVSRHRGYLMPWMELISANNKSQLSKKADQIRYGLSYDYDRDNATQGLANELSNARKPSAGPDREHAIKIIKFMRQHKLATVKELVAALAEKWKTPAKAN
jgi:hypothetical protein